MTEQTLSFEEILERERYILVDGSVSCQNEESLGWYFNEIYPANSFLEISKEVLRKVRDDLDFFVSFLENPGVYTPPGIIPELEGGRVITQDSIDFFQSGVVRSEMKSSAGRTKKRFRGRINPGETQRNLLCEIRDLFYSARFQAKKSLFEPPEKDRYEYLEKIVLGVTENTRPKIDSNLRYEKPSNIKEDFHTDEQLVSLALYLSVQGEESCIVTRDSSIRRILINTLRFLSHPRAFVRDDLLNILQERKITIYYNNAPRRAYNSFDTSQFELVREFNPRKIDAVNEALRS